MTAVLAAVTGEHYISCFSGVAQLLRSICGEQHTVSKHFRGALKSAPRGTRPCILLIMVMIASMSGIFITLKNIENAAQVAELDSSSLFGSAWACADVHLATPCSVLMHSYLYTIYMVIR